MRIKDADAVYKDICDSLNQMTKIGIAVDGEWLWEKLNDALENAPTIEMLENTQTIEIDRPQGEWIVYDGRWENFDYYPPKRECSRCGYEEDLYILNEKPTNFCPNCGADLRGGRRE